MTEELTITRSVFDPGAAWMAGRRLFMCRHHSDRDRPMEEITVSHALDLMYQERFGVRWLSYFVSRVAGYAYCLCEAPSREAVEACHLAAHGHMPFYRVIEVEWDALRSFLGEIATPGARQDWEASPFRTIFFVEAANAAELSLRLGDAEARREIQVALTKVKEAVEAGHGTVVSQESSTLLASFTSTSRAVECAILVQNRLTATRGPAASVDLRIGLNAGEPVTDEGELFGAAVLLSRRVCSQAAPRSILVSGVVRDLCVGKGFDLVPRGAIEVSNDEPVRLYEVQSHVGAPVSLRPTRFPDGLTEREVEVLRLIAAGRSNQHIADALVITLNTTARHVANILGKTGSANRTEAAAYAYRERLI